MQIGLESPTHSIVDKSLGSLETILSVLDFSTIKNEVFPIVAAVFSKTSSLGIKIRGLEAFVVLCGGSKAGDDNLGDGLDGAVSATQGSGTKSTAILDKYTVQEKVVPLIRAIKTKEPAVMIAALAVFRQVAKIADVEFLAIEVLPILWSFSLGPLLNLDQFQQYMALIKSISTKIENEQIRKLRDLSSNHGTASSAFKTDRSTATTNGLHAMNGGSDVGEDDFQKLVLGKGTSGNNDILGDGWTSQPQQQSQAPPMFSWSTPAIQSNQSRSHPSSMIAGLSSTSNAGSRAITPDHTMSSFTPLSPAPRAGNTMTMSPSGFNALTPMQPATANSGSWTSPHTVPVAGPSSFLGDQSQSTMMPPPPMQPSTTVFSSFSIAPPPSGNSRPLASSQTNGSFGKVTAPPALKPANAGTQAPPKKGLDAYESLI